MSEYWCLLVGVHFSTGSQYPVGVLHLLNKSISSELKFFFLLIMCIDAPESTTKSRSSGLFELTGVDIPLTSPENRKRSFVQIPELVNNFRQIPRCFAGASFSGQDLLM